MANLSGAKVGCDTFRPVHRLDNPVMGYAWGSRTAIAELQGRPPSREPEAELWLGAHSKAPSRVVGSDLALDALIAREPARLLGPSHRELPFLLKVLAAAEPLSLQAHPSLEQARLGYIREESLGIDPNAPERSYKDPNPKPELICALTPFVALSGFLPADAAADALAAFGLEGEARTVREARGAPEVLRPLLSGWLRLDSESRAHVVAPVRARAEQVEGGPHAETARWLRKLGALYGNDPGLLVTLLLQRYELRPLQALALDAGNLHAYLEGVAIEIMASSDNVLRGGLTPKHVDVAQLLAVLRFDERPLPLEPSPIDAQRSVYHTHFPQFQLERHVIDGESERFTLAGPAIALVLEGALTLHTQREHCALERSESVFVGADEGELRWSGRGTAFVATTPSAPAHGGERR